MSTTTDSTNFEEEIRAEGIDLAAVEENRPGVDPKPAWWPEWLKKLADDVGPFHPKVTHASACLFYTPQSSPSKSTTPPTTVKPPKDYNVQGQQSQKFFGPKSGDGVTDGPLIVRTLLSDEKERQREHDKLEADVNSALYFLQTSIQEQQAKVALEEQNKHVDKAIASRDAALAAKKEAQKHLDVLLQQRDRAEAGLTKVATQWSGTPWHKLPPTVQKVRSDLKRSVVTLLSCVITAQHRLIKYSDEIKNFDQILFQLGASSCSLCGHHLDNGFDSEEKTDSAIVIGGGGDKNTCPIIIADAAEASGTASSLGSGEGGACSSTECSQNSAVSVDDGSDNELDVFIDRKGKRPADDTCVDGAKHARY